MRIAYFDCFSGISGDMVLGAMLDAGVDIESVKRELMKLNLDGYEIRVSKVDRNGLAGTKVDVVVDEEKHIHSANYGDIKKIIEESRLSERIKNDSIRIFKRIAEAEAKIHNTSIDNIHFHEVGAVDSIIDVVGAAVCINLLAIDEVISSPVNTGSGIVKTRHGLLPVPAPAAAEMLRGFPFYSSDIKFELATPTGVGIITTMAKEFNLMPLMKTTAIGYGAGSSNFLNLPNILRIVIGETYNPLERDSVIVIESNIDDMNPQFYDHIIDRLFEGGALDVFLTPVIMKKSRSAVKITILSPNDKLSRLIDILFKETTSFGLRTYRVERIKLEREIKIIETGYGNVKVKLGMREGEVVAIAPEYEDCKRIAIESGESIKEVYEKIKSTAEKLKSVL
ncbi:MAG: TIGR00299 family protein [Nitrospinae bacterium RIFCSPLOWO2_02_FULL_39_110]|nr:MAG: TIGR00299 family protein [Nitrospinae bacterium RIFCSPHIGHO2_02_39_11]OGV99688.1 MAG: TIGR00299 family protein [Nitrospinae bacterium RIFCSPHIGHO2_12_FULL_39_42]OGW03344.1 MAG: TIGR00299 family protein [Nitrospinae bacterium RIFCSPLOWO2_02_FULL_39_110]OGW06625.1 MAG: TIGR00299 family protein [Nitrospinae bacterium RIFCSPLOWO2_02_39_17]OGW08084.1 MAG: TIGR00299 family protein [Nitrospinae bacterium RIFCSPLOWO2_12_FULL_39_93]OGW10809.1 MAG: TIGR00299 family protein [Nitrospinae bacterium